MSIDIKDGCIYIYSELTLSTVAPVFARLKKLVAANQVANINLQGVTNCDTAGVAMLIYFANGGKLKFTHASPQLLNLAKISGVEKLFN